MTPCAMPIPRNEVRLMIKLDEGGDAETLAKGLEGVEVLGNEY